MNAASRRRGRTRSAPAISQRRRWKSSRLEASRSTTVELDVDPTVGTPPEALGMKGSWPGFMGIRRSAASPLAPALSRSVEFRPLPTPRTTLAQSALRPRYPRCAPIVLSFQRGSRTMSSRPLPRDLNRALDRLNAEPERPWTLSSLAAACGVAPRTLHKHFRRFLGRTPHEFIRELRLDRARQLLLRGLAQASVTDVAARCGFDHLGRFATWYRERYGENPSATLL